MTKTINKLLALAPLAIENALANKEILKLLTAFGYSATKIREGKLLCEETAALNVGQKKYYGQQFRATDAYNTIRREAEKMYTHHIVVARLAFKNDREWWKTLQLSGSRKRAYADWIDQANTFYSNAPDGIEEFKKFNITQAELDKGKIMIQNVAAAYARQKIEAGLAQQATQQRDAALEALHDWMSDFMAVARVALKEHPQQLEALGVIA